MEIGIRELRDGLSRHLAEVRAGRVVTITDHGQPIARIVPIDRPTRLEALIAEGRVRPAVSRKQPAGEPVDASGSVSDLIDHHGGDKRTVVVATLRDLGGHDGDRHQGSSRSIGRHAWKR